MKRAAFIVFILLCMAAIYAVGINTGYHAGFHDGELWSYQTSYNVELHQL